MQHNFIDKEKGNVHVHKLEILQVIYEYHENDFIKIKTTSMCLEIKL